MFCCCLLLFLKRVFNVLVVVCFVWLFVFVLKCLFGVVILNWEVTTPDFSNMFKKDYGIEATKSTDKYFDAVYVMAQAIANSSDTSQVSAYITKNTFTTPNGTISFTADHAVKDTTVQIQVMNGGVPVVWR